MLKVFLYSIKKSRRLRKISNILGAAARVNASDLTDYLAVEGRMEKSDKAMEELLTLCEHDPFTAIMMRKHKADREILRKAYDKLIDAGAGQWKKGHYVPASSLVYNQTLEYLLRNVDKDAKDFQYVAWRLLKYFENGAIGTVEE